MTKNKLAIIGGSGLYDVEEFKEREFLNAFLSLIKVVISLNKIPFLG